MSNIIRGTTPTIRYTFSTVQVSTIRTAYLTLKQTSCNIELDLTSATVDAENNALEWKLSQEDTLKINASNRVDIQVRYKLADGSAGASQITSINAYKILKDGEI